MKKVMFLICAGLATAAVSLNAQVYGLSGVVRDSLSGEPISGAVVRVTDPDGVEAISDPEGNYLLLLPVGNYRVSVEMNGMEPLSKVIELNSDFKLNFRILDADKIYRKIRITAITTIECGSSADVDAQRTGLSQTNILREIFRGNDVNLKTQLTLRIKSTPGGEAGIKYVLELQFEVKQHPLRLPFRLFLANREY